MAETESKLEVLSLSRLDKGGRYDDVTDTINLKYEDLEGSESDRTVFLHFFSKSVIFLKKIKKSRCQDRQILKQIESQKKIQGMGELDMKRGGCY